MNLGIDLLEKLCIGFWWGSIFQNVAHNRSVLKVHIRLFGPYFDPDQSFEASGQIFYRIFLL